MLQLRHPRRPLASSATHQEGSWLLLTHQPLRGVEHDGPQGHSAGGRQAGRRGLGSFPVSDWGSTHPPPTCLMCRRDLKTDSFRGCQFPQFPQSASKDESVGHLFSSRPSAPSGNTGAFSSSSASELSQLSDSSSNSARWMTNTVMKHATHGFLHSLDATVSFHAHFSPRHLMVKPPGC